MPVISLKDLKAQLPKGRRLMGIDHGTKTWGLALADPGLKMATPFKTIHRTKFMADLQKLGALCREYEVGGLIVGLPLNMDGSRGPRTDSVEHFGVNIIKSKDVFGLDPLIAFHDERLSTWAAEQALIQDLDMSREKRRDIIDAQAAAGILQSALDVMAAI